MLVYLKNTCYNSSKTYPYEMKNRAEVIKVAYLSMIKKLKKRSFGKLSLKLENKLELILDVAKAKLKVKPNLFCHFFLT